MAPTGMNGTSSSQRPSSDSSSSPSPASAPAAGATLQDGLLYHHGFGNHHESEAVPGTLPLGRNNPRLVPGKLYAEQLSGTAFTSPRDENRRTWLYRIRPGVSGTSGGFVPCGGEEEEDGGGVECDLPRHFGRCDWSAAESSSSSNRGGKKGPGGLRLDPNPMRWGPVPLPSEEEEAEVGESPLARDFVQGMRTMTGCGDATARDGLAMYVYAVDGDMTGHRGGDDGGSDRDRHMYNSDGDMLIVPQVGTLDVTTELGRMIVRPTEICVLPRGVVFSVNIYEEDGGGSDRNAGSEPDDRRREARGYVLEIFRGHFALPELGPIGSNGLANRRDFLVPSARYETDPTKASRPCRIVNKFGNRLFVRESPRSPYDVVAWHGNYVPYKYDLTKFCAVNSVTYDHLDPSIYTVLTAQSGVEDGTALADFVVFPPRIMATDSDTFRPPWFHRNVMSEFMGLIYGEYDAKGKGMDGKKGGFKPGGASLHNTMTPHGPDAASYRKAVSDPCDAPKKFEGGMAFMFETCLTLKCSEYALECDHREREYARCWDGLEDEFSGWLAEKAEKEKDKAVGKGGDGDAMERETKRARI